MMLSTGICCGKRPARSAIPDARRTAPAVEPRSGILILRWCNMQKKPVLAYELFFKYGGEGIDSLCSPCGQPVRYALSLSNWLSPVVDPVGASYPRSGLLIPGGWCNMQKKPAFSCELFFKYGGEGIDSLCSPYGQPVRYALSLSSWLRQLSNRSGILIPAGVQHAKKSPHFHASSS